MDILVDEMDDMVAVVEVKATDWDRIKTRMSRGISPLTVARSGATSRSISTQMASKSALA